MGGAARSPAFESKEEWCIGGVQDEAQMRSRGHKSLICRMIFQCVCVRLGEDIVKENPGVTRVHRAQPSCLRFPATQFVGFLAPPPGRTPPREARLTS